MRSANLGEPDQKPATKGRAKRSVTAARLTAIASEQPAVISRAMDELPLMPLSPMAVRSMLSSAAMHSQDSTTSLQAGAPSGMSLQVSRRFSSKCPASCSLDAKEWRTELTVSTSPSLFGYPFSVAKASFARDTTSFRRAAPGSTRLLTCINAPRRVPASKAFAVLLVVCGLPCCCPPEKASTSLISMDTMQRCMRGGELKTSSIST
mmetsp:Transcript_2931/g.7656  ORF Transcript_2931/g.7656 Transcript_2931/m.7656 type:complete len:207 (+) Transcript_2931:1124-1744(+)